MFSGETGIFICYVGIIDTARLLPIGAAVLVCGERDYPIRRERISIICPVLKVSKVNLMNKRVLMDEGWSIICLSKPHANGSPFMHMEQGCVLSHL